MEIPTFLESLRRARQYYKNDPRYTTEAKIWRILRTLRRSPIPGEAPPTFADAHYVVTSSSKSPWGPVFFFI